LFGKENAKILTANHVALLNLLEELLQVASQSTEQIGTGEEFVGSRGGELPDS